MVCQNANLVLACSCGEKQAQIRVRPARSRDAASTTTLLQAPALSAVPCGGEHWPAGSGVWIYCHLVPKWVRERLSRESLARVSALIAAQRTFGELNEGERKPHPQRLANDAGRTPSRRRPFLRVSRHFSQI